MIEITNPPSRNTLKLLIAFALLTIFSGIGSVFFPKLGVATIILIPVILVAIVASYRWPEMFLMLAIGTNFMKSAYVPGLSLGEFGATPYMVFTSLAALGFIIQIIVGKRHLALPSGLWFFLLFIGFTTLSLINVLDFRLAIGAYIRNVLDWLLMVSIIQMLTDEGKVKKLISVLIFQAVIVASWGVLAGIRLEFISGSRRSLFFWQQFQKNDFAAYLGIVLILALATFTLAKSRKNKLFSLYLLPLIPLGWVFTFSRGGFLAIAVCLFVFLILERNRKLWQRSFIIIILVGLLGTGFLLLSSSNARDLAIDGLRSIITGESDAERHTDTITFRIELANSAIDVVAKHPILGVGFNQWQFYSPITTRVFDPQANEFRETGYAIHNRLLGIAANNGLFAFLGYIGFVLLIFFYGLQKRGTAPKYIRTYLNVFVAALVGMQVAMIFAPSVLWEWPVIGILLGLIRVCNNLPTNQRIYIQERSNDG